jgi:hypothetical protein
VEGVCMKAFICSICKLVSTKVLRTFKPVGVDSH